MCAAQTNPHTKRHYLHYAWRDSSGKKCVNSPHMTSCPNQGLSQFLSERSTWLTPSAGYLRTVDVCDGTASVCVRVHPPELTNPAVEWQRILSCNCEKIAKSDISNRERLLCATPLWFELHTFSLTLTDFRTALHPELPRNGWCRLCVLPVQMRMDVNMNVCTHFIRYTKRS